MRRFLRSPREYGFRIRQEAENLRLLLAAPAWKRRPPGRLGFLPDWEPAVERLQGTPFRDQLQATAEEILQHRFPLLGTVLETGPEIAWRRDYQRSIETGTGYFRNIPYLDVTRSGDHKLIWELNRHQHLVLLAQTALVSGQDRYVTEILQQLESWRRQNPFQRGMNWTSALEVAFRSISWTWLLHLIGPRLPDWFAETLYRHGRHLAANLSVYFSPNTHLLGEAVALDLLGRVFEEKEWSRKGAAVIREQAIKQVQADGVHFEQSSYYHVYALDMFLLHAIVSGDVDGWSGLLERMAEYLRTLHGPCRTIPFLGDDDGGRLFHPYGSRAEFGCATLTTCSILLRRPELWMPTDEDLWTQALWWLGADAVEGARFSGTAGEGDSRVFPQAGVAVLRSDPYQVVMDVGPFGSGGAGHSHSDTLSIIVRSATGDILLDPGTYTYMGPERNWFRGSAAHNTIRIDGRDQAVAVNPFRWEHTPQVKVLAWEAGEQKDFLDAECRYGECVHRRRILWVKSPAPLLLVADDISGPSGEHVVEQTWHAALEPRKAGTGAYRIGSSLLILDGDSGLPQEAWQSPALGSRQPSFLLQRKVTAALPLRMCAAILPSGQGSVVIRNAEAVFVWRTPEGGEHRFSLEKR